MAPSAEAFRLSIPETALADLKARLAMTRFPDQAPDGPWGLWHRPGVRARPAMSLQHALELDKGHPIMVGHDCEPPCRRRDGSQTM
jgi:hypothetical protein